MHFKGHHELRTGYQENEIEYVVCHINSSQIKEVIYISVTLGPVSVKFRNYHLLTNDFKSGSWVFMYQSGFPFKMYGNTVCGSLFSL